MRPLALARDPLAPVTVDTCDNCQALWLDATESQQLTPGTLIELFRTISASRPQQRAAFPALLPCPRCTQPLVVTHDLCKSGPLQYFRCPQDGGRLTTFFQFLREKQFLRALHPQRCIAYASRSSSCNAPTAVHR